ncbi:MAG: permease prefix domain 1-containing protein [Clostridiales bacterium]
MNKIKYHVNLLFKKIPDSEQKENIIQEIIDNLEEKVRDLMSEGKDEDDAINKALIDFGDIEDIKKELYDKYHNINREKKAYINWAYSVWGSILIILLTVFTNLYYSPKVIWFIYPTFVILWWPLTMLYVWLRIRGENR